MPHSMGIETSEAALYWARKREQPYVRISRLHAQFLSLLAVSANHKTSFPEAFDLELSRVKVANQFDVSGFEERFQAARKAGTLEEQGDKRRTIVHENGMTVFIEGKHGILTEEEYREEPDGTKQIILKSKQENAYYNVGLLLKRGSYEVTVEHDLPGMTKSLTGTFIKEKMHPMVKPNKRLRYGRVSLAA